MSVEEFSHFTSENLPRSFFILKLLITSFLIPEPALTFLQSMRQFLPES